MCINKSTYPRYELITHPFIFAYICIYANVSLTCMTHHIFAYMNKLPPPIYLHICKYSFFIYVSILYLHIGINYFALHICIYNICSNMSLWHIHLYHIFAYFNKLTPEGEGRAGSGAHLPRFGGGVWGLTPHPVPKFSLGLGEGGWRRGCGILRYSLFNPFLGFGRRGCGQVFLAS